MKTKYSDTTHYSEETRYLGLLENILDNGVVKGDRTGTGTYSLFGCDLRFDISCHSLPVVTTRKIKPLDPIIEMLWFIKGDTNIRFLKEHNINIWDSWVREETKEFDTQGKLIAGSIGPGAYGAQWRRWEDTRIVSANEGAHYKKFGYEYVTNLTNPQGVIDRVVLTRTIDQLADAINMIKNNPDSRRIIVTAWNPGRFEDQALPPCHSLFQFYTRDLNNGEKAKMIMYMSEKNQKLKDHFSEGFGIVENHELDEAINLFGLPTKSLSLKLFCRSQDAPVGSVYNIIQYAALAHMVAQVTNTWATEFIWTSGDTHVYSNQIDGVRTQLERTPIECDTKLVLNPEIKNIDDFKPSDISVTDYEHHPFIKYPIAI